MRAPRLGQRTRWIPWAAGAWALGAVLLVVVGATPWLSAALSAAVVLQALSGMVVWVAVVSPRDRPRDMLQLIGMGLAVGVGLAAASGVMVSLVLPGWPGWLVPAVAAGAVWFRPASTLHRRTSWTWYRPAVIATVVGLTAGTAGIALNMRRYPLDWAGDWAGYHIDMVFFEALSTSIARYGPLDSIFMAGAEIRYHWLGYAWVGQLAETFDTPPFLVLTRVLPFTALVAVMCLAASWAASRSRNWRVPTLAVLLIATGGYLGAVNGTVLNFDSPSEAMAAAWLLALLTASLMVLRGRTVNRRLVLLVGVLAAVATGGKISAGAVALAGIGMTALLLSVRRDPLAGRAWLLLGTSGAGFVVAFLLLISGTATGGTLQVLSVAARAASVQGLILDRSPLGVAAGTVSLVIAMSARWAGVGWLVLARRSRWQPQTLLGVGLVVGSVLPVLVLSEGVSETWFGLAASAPLSVLSAVGLGMAWRQVQSRAALALSVIAAMVVLPTVTFLWAQGEPNSASARFWGPPIAVLMAICGGAVVAMLVRTRTRRLAVWTASTMTILVMAAVVARFIPTVAAVMPKIQYLTGPVGNVGTALYLPDETGTGLLPPAVLNQAVLPPNRPAWSANFAEAGEFLYAHTGPADIVVTNENTSFLVPALARRLTYMSGAPYQWQYGNASIVGTISQRVSTSQDFVNDASPEAFAELCRAGVTWLWASHDLTDRRDWQPYATVEFANDEVTIAHIDRSGCP